MIKKVLALLFCCTMLCACSNDKKDQVQIPAANKQAETETLKADYKSKQYVGRFVLREGLHANDPFVLNHMTPYRNQQVKYENGRSPAYNWYDVYCEHDHKGDVQEVRNDAEINRISFTGYIVPLNVKGEPMLGRGKNIQESIIVSQALIATKGTWGFEPLSLKTYNNTDRSLIMEIKGHIGSEILHKNSAAVAIVNLTAPHKKITRVDGYREYIFK